MVERAGGEGDWRVGEGGEAGDRPTRGEVGGRVGDDGRSESYWRQDLVGITGRAQARFLICWRLDVEGGAGDWRRDDEGRDRVSLETVRGRDRGLL